MKNRELIRAFANGARCGVGSNLYIVGDDLINYGTIIVSRCRGGVKLNATHYSVTTSTNQNMIRDLCNVIEEYKEH